MWFFFLHELIWYVFKKKLHHKHHIWIGFFLQKLNPFPLWVNFCHKWYILVVSFLNELIKNVYLLFRLSYLVKLASQMLHLNGLIPSWMGTDATCCLIYPPIKSKKCDYKCHIWMASLLHELLQYASSDASLF